MKKQIYSQLFKLIAVASQGEALLPDHLARLSVSVPVLETYAAQHIDLSPGFHDHLRAIWEAKVDTGTPLPPLPNMRISLPFEITEVQSTPPDDLSTEAVREKASLSRSSWIAQTIRRGDSVAYKNTYGAGSSISRNRKQLIDMELAHEFSFYICYVTAEVVKFPRELDADHICSWDTIKQNIWDLVYAMNSCPEFGQAVMEEFSKNPITNAFIYDEKDGRTNAHIKYYPTKWFFRLYFNDISNLLLVKKVENEDRSTSNIADYLAATFGRLLYSTFLESVGIDTSSIIQRTKDGRGLGEAMRCWFFHNNRDIVGLFDTSLHVTENLNQKVREILQLRQERQLTGGSVSGRIRAEQGRATVLEVASEVSLSSDSDSDQGVQDRAAALSLTLGQVLAKATKIAKAVVRELPESAQTEIRDMDEFMIRLRMLIKEELEKEGV